MGGFAQGLMDLFSPGGIPGQRRQRTLDARQKVEDQQQDDEFDQKFAEHMTQIGALPVMGGAVRRKMYHPGNPDMGIGPNEGELVEPADKSRTITHKTRGGNSIQFELPSREEQIRRGSYEKMAEAMSPTRRIERANTEEMNTAQARGTGAGKSQADLSNRQANGLPIGTKLAEILGVSPETIMLPTEIDELARAAGSLETADKRGPRTVQGSQVVRDDEGNQTLVTKYSDGTFDERKLNAKGVKTRPRATGGAKQPTRQQFGSIEARKSVAMAKSKAMLQKEMIEDPSASEDAKARHAERVQDAQIAYEAEISALTGNDVGHNDWADKKALGTGGQAQTPPLAGKPQLTVGQKVRLKDGRTVTVTKVDADDFDYE